MSAFLFGYEPRYRAIDANGNPIPGAILRFSVSPGTTPTDPYSDSTLTTPVTTTQGAGSAEADAGGLFAAIYLNSAVTYRVRLFTSAGVLVWDQDPVAHTIDISQAIIGAALYPRTAAEISAGVTPTNYAYPPLHIARYGGVNDGTFTAGGSAGGTDNLAALNSAFSVASVKGGVIEFGEGVYYFSDVPDILPSGVWIAGKGQCHLPFFLSGTRIGTMLLIQGGVGDNCIEFESDGAGHSGLRDISIFNTTTNTINAVIEIAGHLHPTLSNVEFGSLRKSAGGGLILTKGATFETLYGNFWNVVCTQTDIGLSTEASIGYALVIDRTSNGNQFFGGVFAGRLKAFLQQSPDGADTGPLNVVFHGTLFEGTYNTDMEHVYIAGSSRIVGLDDGTNRYGVKLLEVQQGADTAFLGCYFEIGGVPGTYNDGVNGSAPLVGLVSNVSSSSKRTSVMSCNWNAAFFYDTGTDTEINPTYDGYRFGTREQPSCVVRNAASQSISDTTDTKLQFGTVLNGNTAYCKWDSSGYQVTIKQQGSYLISGAVTMVGWNTANTYARATIVTSQGNFVGFLGQQGTGVPISVHVAGVIKLNAGDTVALNVYHNQGGSQNTSAAVDESFLSVVKVG